MPSTATKPVTPRALATSVEAAEFLAMNPNSLRRWASRDCGPTLPSGQRIRPVKVVNRLRWRWSDLNALASATLDSAA